MKLAELVAVCIAKGREDQVIRAGLFVIVERTDHAKHRTQQEACSRHDTTPILMPARYLEAIFRN